MATDVDPFQYQRRIRALRVVRSMLHATTETVLNPSNPF
jgi:hypothetical protein